MYVKTSFLEKMEFSKFLGMLLLTIVGGLFLLGGFVRLCLFVFDTLTGSAFS